MAAREPAPGDYTARVPDTESVSLAPPDFAAALREHLDDVDLGRFAADLGVSERTVRSWMRGERVTSPDTVFAIERRLSLEPGSLSAHLGYLPLDARRLQETLLARGRAVAREEMARYRSATPEEALELLASVDVEEVIRRALRREFMRLVSADLEREFGPVSGEDRLAARSRLGLDASPDDVG
jgi:transcriptional regulator with XRE-family HTH domain